MRKMRMCFPNERTFQDGFEEYILDCKVRNLREGTITHYREIVRQLYKRIPPDTPISSFCPQTMTRFYIALRDDPNLNEVSMGTYARDLKTLLRFFMKCNYIPHFDIPLPKADQGIDAGTLQRLRHDGVVTTKTLANLCRIMHGTPAERICHAEEREEQRVSFSRQEKETLFCVMKSGRRRRPLFPCL